MQNQRVEAVPSRNIRWHSSDGGTGRFGRIDRIVNKPTKYLVRSDRIERWLWVRSAERIISPTGMPGDRYEFIDLGRFYRYIWIDYRWPWWLEEGEYVRLVATVKQVERNTVRLHYVTVY